jgi:hypothetical protein
VIAKSIILSSLELGVSNIVLIVKMLMSYGKPSRSKMRVQNEGSIALKQLANESAESMYSHLNVLVNDINTLGVKTSPT